MPSVPREVIEHHLVVCPQVHPVKQKKRRQAPEKQDFIIQEVDKLNQCKLIRKVAHPTWIANLVIVPKANNSGRLCVDFTSLNKAYPKDPYLLLRIDQIIGSTTGCDLLCFLDAFSRYHQINMAKEDEEKTTFITPCGVYCYVCMPFGLKNAGVTFQRLMQKALGAQMGRNVEAYVDDIIVKTREGRTLVEYLEETFANLQKVNINLNPTMCLWCTLREATGISRFAPQNRGKP
jgi:putative transposase